MSAKYTRKNITTTKKRKYKPTKSTNIIKKQKLNITEKKVPTPTYQNHDVKCCMCKKLLTTYISIQKITFKHCHTLLGWYACWDHYDNVKQEISKWMIPQQTLIQQLGTHFYIDETENTNYDNTHTPLQQLLRIVQILKSPSWKISSNAFKTHQSGDFLVYITTTITGPYGYTNNKEHITKLVKLQSLKQFNTANNFFDAIPC
jgi:hypothetical protein